MAEGDENDELEKLRAKRDELLGEVKALKAKNAELESARAEAVTRADAAEGEVRRVRLDEPVEAVLGDLFTVRLKHVLPEIREHFDFALGEDGEISFTTKDGEPVTIGSGSGAREAGFTADDVRAALVAHGAFDEILRAPGAGGSGKPPGSGSTAQDAQRQGQKPARVAPTFGLR